MGAPDDIKNSATWKKVLLLRNLHLNGQIVIIFHDMHKFKSQDPSCIAIYLRLTALTTLNRQTDVVIFT